MPKLRNGNNGDSNPGSLDCESGILPTELPRSTPTLKPLVYISSFIICLLHVYVCATFRCIWTSGRKVICTLVSVLKCKMVVIVFFSIILTLIIINIQWNVWVDKWAKSFSDLNVYMWLSRWLFVLNRLSKLVSLCVLTCKLMSIHGQETC